MYNEYKEDQQANAFDQYKKDLVYQDKTFKLDIHDLGGQPDNKDKRIVSYEGRNLVVICYDVSSVNSVNAINQTWIQEIEEGGLDKNVPVVIIGCKDDITDKAGETRLN